MIYTYQDILQIYGTNFKAKKAMGEGKLRQVEKNIYADSIDYDDLMILIKKFCERNECAFTLDDAFYAHGLIKEKPKVHYLATSKDATKIHDARVKQIFSQDDVLPLGKMEMEHKGLVFPVYDFERTLIELCRFKTKIPLPIYREAVHGYREAGKKIDRDKLYEYLSHFPKMDSIRRTMENEIL